MLTGCGEVEDTRPGQPVKQRQVAFKEIVKTFEPMGVMLRKDRYDADKFLPMAEALLAADQGHARSLEAAGRIREKQESLHRCHRRPARRRPEQGQGTGREDLRGRS